LKTDLIALYKGSSLSLKAVALQNKFQSFKQMLNKAARNILREAGVFGKFM
jgi:hypothetical protein